MSETRGWKTWFTGGGRDWFLIGTMAVGSGDPNKYGLYDVRGNVWEWCSDWWNNKRYEKVLRGGS